MFEDFKEVRMMQLPSRIRGVFGGACLGVDCNHEFFAFYDWTTGRLLRRIDAQVEVGAASVSHQGRELE